MASTTGRGNAGLILLTAFALLVFAVITFAAVKAAGGTDIAPDYSNTPNATVPGPPAFR